MDHRARAVAHDLDFDVARVLDEAFDEERTVAEGRSRLLRCPLEALVDVFRRPGHEHAAAAAAGAGLDQHGIPDRACEFPGLGRRTDLVGAGDDGHARVCRDGAGREFVAQPLDGFGPRPNEGNPVPLAEPGKGRRLGKEAVAGMQRIAPGRLRRVHHQVSVEIAVACRRRPEHDSTIRELGGEALPINIGDADDRLKPERVAGANDAHGDFAPVGDEDAREGHHACTGADASGSTRKSGAPNSTISPSSTQALAIRPLTPARTGVNSFITSIRHTSVASLTCSPTST